MPMNSMWAVPMLVMMPGSAWRSRKAVRSRRDGSCPFPRRRPCVLPARERLEERRCGCSDCRGWRRRRTCGSTAAVKSLVLVLPLEPVMATTGMFNCLRHQWASFCKAAGCIRNLITRGIPGCHSIDGQWPPWRRNPMAPLAKASPSKFSPRRAKECRPCDQLAGVRRDSAG
jgi:hypothetical protein